MMAGDWWTYVSVVTVLVSIPGPSQLLMISSTVANGLPRALATGAGDLSANVIQMLAASIGLGAVITTSQTGFIVVKWCGVAYLSYLGIARLMAPRETVLAVGVARPLRALWRDGFVTSAANPKAVLFFAALFPQFVDPGGALQTQVAVLGVTYLALDALLLTAYGVASMRIASRLGNASAATIDRLGGGFMIGAAALLASKR